MLFRIATRNKLVLLTVFIYTRCYPKFSGLVLPSVVNLTFGLMVTITLEVVPIRTYTPVPALLPLVKHFWKSCSLRVFITASDAS